MTGILSSDLRHFVVRPVLQFLEVWSPSAENLILGTAACESYLGRYLKQRKGKALGLYQIEPSRHDAVWSQYLDYHRELADKVNQLASRRFSWTSRHQDLLSNLNYSTAIAQMVYQGIKEPLPAQNDIEAMASYWYRHYNLMKRKSGLNIFISNYQQLVE